VAKFVRDDMQCTVECTAMFSCCFHICVSSYTVKQASLDIAINHRLISWHATFRCCHMLSCSSRYMPRNLQLSTRLTLKDSIKSSNNLPKCRGTHIALLAQNKIYDALYTFNHNPFASNYSDNAANA